MSISKIIGAFIIVVIAFSCNKKLDQKTMFKGRENKTKKRGIYDAGLNSKKPVSVQIAKEYDKLSKNDKNPKKAAKKANKELEKKKRHMAKHNSKFVKTKKLKVKVPKEKSGGDK